MQSVPQGGSRGPCGPCGPAVSMTCSCGGGDGVVVRAANNQLLLTIAAGCLLFTFHAYVFYSNDIIAPNILPAGSKPPLARLCLQWTLQLCQRWSADDSAWSIHIFYISKNAAPELLIG